MSKFKKVISLMTSGDIEAAADAFVDRLFDKVLDAKLNAMIKESASALSREQIRAISGISNDDLIMLDNAFDDNSNRYGELDVDELLPLLKARTGVSFPEDEDVLHDVWATIQDELEVRGDELHGGHNDGRDFERDYDAEDRAAAFNDRYQMYKNEY